MPLSKPSAIGHLEKARTSVQLYRQLKAEGILLGWAVTALFYAAMHLVQAQFVEEATTGFDIPHNHPDRDFAVSRRLPKVYLSYSFLYTRSQWARYHVDKPDPTPDQIRRYEEDHFRPIEKAMQVLDVVL